MSAANRACSCAEAQSSTQLLQLPTQRKLPRYVDPHAQAKAHPELLQYAARISGQVFASPLPPAPQLNSPEWEARAAGASGNSAAR